MGRIILFFLGSALFLSGCKNSKQPEGYNSVNIIEYVNVYDENNRILTAQGVLGKRRFLPPYFVGLQQIN